MWNGDRKTKSLREVVENAPKTLDKEYLQVLYTALFHHKLEPDVNLEDIISSLLLLVIDGNVPVSVRHFAIAILQKLSPLKGVSEVINFEDCNQLLSSLPVLLSQDFLDCGIDDVIRNMISSLYHENWPVEFHYQLLAFLSKAIASSKLTLSQEDLGKISSLLSQWLIIPVTVPSSRPQGFRRSSSSLSITEIDGTDTQDFFTVLNYAPTLNPMQFRNIQVFSMMKSYLINSNAKVGKGSKQTLSFMGCSSFEDLSHSLREYCMRIIDQVDRRVQSASAAEFQKACLIESIDLFNILCLVDSGIIHTIFPIIRRIYGHVYSNVYSDPEVQDIAVMASAMRFFINHGSSVMHKPDNLYVYMFCDLLNQSYKDNYIAYEIIQLMKENLSQLCYHSSILEKYFPTFFKIYVIPEFMSQTLKVLAWRPNTFLDDFLELLPAFMSQHTSIEVFYMLLDLPCLTAILILTENKSSILDPKAVKDSGLLEGVKKPEVASMIQFMLRQNSGIGDTFESVSLLHKSLSSLASDYRVMCCAEAVIPLLKKYFKIFLQYADTSVTALLIPAILERLSILFPVPKYAERVHNVLAGAVVQLFELHPETIFHSQKTVMTYINYFKNYFIAQQNFMNMIWIIGEYISVSYSKLCRPEVIAIFFESLESTTYEALSYLQESSDDMFLKLLSIALTTLSKLAARNQDQVPRAVLCLSKAHQQLSSFGNDYKKNWKIVMERVLELLSILNSPNVAAIVLSPPKQLEYGRLHRDSTCLPYVLRAITRVVTTNS